MTSSINSTPKFSLSQKHGMSKLEKPSKNNQSLFKVAQKASVFCHLVGGVMSLVTQQYAILPLSLSFILIHQANHRRLELLQATEQKQQTAIIEMQQGYVELENQLQQLTTTVKQPEDNSRKYLTKTHLTPIIGKLNQIQRQQKAVELIGQEESKQIQQQLQGLNERTTRNSEQLTKVQYQLNSNRKETPATESTYVQPNERVAIFIDAANIYHAATQRGFKIDYAKLLSVLADKSKVTGTYFYTAVDPANKEQQRFLSKIRRLGFKVVSKEIVRRRDGSMKGNLDQELTLGLVKYLINTYDTAILVSGDGDFISAVKDIQGNGKRLEVASFRSDTSAALIKVADSYLDLETVQDQIF
ncbi:NYN domain-containing protein [Nostoc sp. UHCC 0302]|uniref:LabA-like NYN domain-containing protein n=1 Tax=Nostoc sp. UHCC 0302 TaxID=3134896 RepID=UPI00311CB2C5